MVKVIFIVGIFLGVFTFIHTLYKRIFGKKRMKREVYKLSRNGIGFLVSGMIMFGLFYSILFESSVLSWTDIKTGLVLSNIWIGIGLLQIVGYFFCMYVMETGGEEKNV